CERQWSGAERLSTARRRVPHASVETCPWFRPPCQYSCRSIENVVGQKAFFEQGERIAMIVRRQARVRAEPAFFHEMKSASHVEADERGVGGPRVHAQPVASEPSALLVSPGENHVHQATSRIVCGARDAVEVKMPAALVRAPDGGIFVRDRK